VLAASESAYRSVGAGIRPGVRRVIGVIRAIEAVVVVAADEMAPSSTKVIVVHVIAAKATHVVSAPTSDVVAAKSTDMTSTKAAHVASTKAAHVAASASAGLCTRGNKAAGKQHTCQNHHRSSSHNILQLVGRTFRHRPCLTLARFSKVKCQRRDALEMVMAIRPLN
jgi:hypothetical protein